MSNGWQIYKVINFDNSKKWAGPLFWWELSTLPDLGKAGFLNESDYSAVKVWRVSLCQRLKRNWPSH